MPNLQEVEQFKYLLNELGDEAEILAERDEEIEDIPPPERGLPEGLSDLLETPEGVPEEPGPEEVPGEPPSEPSLDQQAVPAEAPAEEAVDLSDLFGDEDLSGLDILEGIELPEGEPEEAAPAAEAPAAEAKRVFNGVAYTVAQLEAGGHTAEQIAAYPVA